MFDLAQSAVDAYILTARSVTAVELFAISWRPIILLSILENWRPIVRPREVRSSTRLAPALLGSFPDLLNSDVDLMFESLVVGCSVTGIDFE